MKLSALTLFLATSLCMETGTAPAPEEQLSLFDFGDFDQIFFPSSSSATLILLSMTCDRFKQFVQNWDLANGSLSPICKQYIYESSNLSKSVKRSLCKNFEDALEPLVIPHDPAVDVFRNVITNPQSKADPKLVAVLVDYPELVNILLRYKEFQEPLATEHILVQPEGTIDADLVVARLGAFPDYESAFKFITRHTMIKPYHFPSLCEKIPENYINQQDAPSFSTGVLLKKGKLEDSVLDLKHDCFSLGIALRLVNDTKSSAVMLSMLKAYGDMPQIAQLFLQHLKFGLFEPLIHDVVEDFMYWLDETSLKDFKVKMIKAIIQYDLDRKLYYILRGNDLYKLKDIDRKSLSNEERLLLVESALVFGSDNEQHLLELCKDVKLTANVFALFAYANVSCNTFSLVANECVEGQLNLNDVIILSSYRFNSTSQVEYADLTKLNFESAEILLNKAGGSFLFKKGHLFLSDPVYSQLVAKRLQANDPQLRSNVEGIINLLYAARPAPLTMLSLLKIMFDSGIDYATQEWLDAALSRRWAYQLFSTMSLENLSKVTKLEPRENSILISTGLEIYDARKSEEA